MNVEDKVCNICTENIKEERLVILQCNPNHYFCYDCIFDWYNTIRFGNNNSNPLTCPICNKNGGFLPLKDPHTKLIENIHIKSNTSNTISNIDIFEYNPIICDCKDCFNISNDIIFNHNNVNEPIIVLNVCYEHFVKHKIGESVITKNNIICHSPYIRCQALLKNKSKCVNSDILKYMNKLNIVNNDYFICKDHKKLYDNGAKLLLQNNHLNINNDTISTQIKPIHKSLCCAPNKSNYGYCMLKLDFIGLCKTDSHNNSMIAEFDTFNDNFSNKKSNNKTNNNTTINDTTLLCNTPLKNNKGICQNKGRVKYNGKCGIHKNY